MPSTGSPGSSAPDVYDSLEELCESDEVDAVYVATPHEFHAEHSIAAMERGKHVIVEKPMALSLDEAEAMNAAADRCGVKLMSGHTHSFDPPVRKMAEVVAGGELGRLLMISTSYYKDHMYRPFSDHDIRMSRGVVLNQGPHQFDIVRLIGGGLVRSVRATAGIGDPTRPGEGHYACHLEFENGVPASLVYSGYAYFDTGELGVGPRRGRPSQGPGKASQGEGVFPGSRRGRRAQPGAGAKAGGVALRRRGSRSRRRSRSRRDRHQPFFGLTVVTCEKGEIRQSRDGLYIYDDNGRREIPVEQGARGREAELREFHDAILHDRQTVPRRPLGRGDPGGVSGRPGIGARAPRGVHVAPGGDRFLGMILWPKQRHCHENYPQMPESVIPAKAGIQGRRG